MHTFDDVVNECLDDQLLAVEQCDDGIRRVLDRLDEVGVHDKLGSVQARHVDHVEKLSNPLGGLRIFALQGRRTHG